MTDFCCSEIFDAFYDGVIEFDEDFPGSVKDLCIVGDYKTGDGTEDSEGRDRFKIYYCPFCGQKLQDL
jgi:hypothetical protein